MPYKTEWVPADVFLVHAGVMVFHAYLEDVYDNRAINWYVWAADADDSEAFDIRKLPEYAEALKHEQVLMAFIDRCKAQGLDPKGESYDYS